MLGAAASPGSSGPRARSLPGPGLLALPAARGAGGARARARRRRWPAGGDPAQVARASEEEAVRISALAAAALHARPCPPALPLRVRRALTMKALRASDWIPSASPPMTE